MDVRRIGDYLEIGVIEAVNNVPSKLLKFFSLQKHGVEENEIEQQLLVLGFCLANIEATFRYQAV